MNGYLSTLKHTPLPTHFSVNYRDIEVSPFSVRHQVPRPPPQSLQRFRASTGHNIRSQPRKHPDVASPSDE